MTGQVTLTTRVPLCSACGVFAAVQRVSLRTDIYAVTGWCTTCRANATYARTDDRHDVVGQPDRHLTGVR